MSITQLPLPPSRQDPNNFAQRADEFLGALPTFVQEANAQATTVNTQTTTVNTQFNDFIRKYLGSQSSAPTTGPSNSALIPGALYWNSSVGDLRVWTGSAWVPVQTTSAATAAAAQVALAEAFASDAYTNANLTAALYDNFDDRYLGAKASAPASDNDGNSILEGAMYWNSTTNELFIRSSNATWNVIGSGVTSFNGRNGPVTLIQADIESALSSATDFTLPNLTVSGDFLRTATVQTVYEAPYTPGMADTIKFHWSSGNFAGGQVLDVKIQPDGKIICVGSFTSYKGTAFGGIVRIGPTGETETVYSSYIDTSFTTGTGFTGGSVYSVDFQSDGKIICGGDFTAYNGTSVGRIARLNTDGSLDTTFVNGTGFTREVYVVKVQSDNKVLVGGSFTSYAATQQNRIIRLNANGGKDSTFNVGTGCDNAVHDIKIASDGKILLGGEFDFYNDALHQGIVRVNGTGSRDATFNSLAVTGGQNAGVDGGVFSIAIQSNNQILLGGSFTTYNGVAVSPGIIRINVNGSRDTGFSAGTIGVDTGYISAIAIQPDGKILLGGAFGVYDTHTNVGNIIRANTNGTRDTTFVTGTGFSGGSVSTKINAIALTSLTRAVIVGDFSSYSPYSPSQVLDIAVLYYDSFAGVNILPPTTGQAGYIRFNSDVGTYEAHNGTEWNILNRATATARVIPSGSMIDVDFKGPESVIYDSTSTANIVFAGNTYRAGNTVHIFVKNPAANARGLTFPAGWKFFTAKPTELAIGKTGLLTLRSFGTTEADCSATWQTT